MDPQLPRCVGKESAIHVLAVIEHIAGEHNRRCTGRHGDIDNAVAMVCLEIFVVRRFENDRQTTRVVDGRNDDRMQAFANQSLAKNVVTGQMLVQRPAA